MRVYVASKFDRYPEVAEIEDALRAQGHEPTSAWTKHSIAGDAGHRLREKLRSFAEADFQGVLDADALIFLHDPGSRGGNTEFGLALAWDKHIAVIGGRTSVPHRASIFYALPQVEHFDTVQGVVDWLTYLEREFAAKDHKTVLEVSR